MIRPLDDPKNFEAAVLDTLTRAQKDDEVIANYFVIRNDHMGLKLLYALKSAAEREVKITLIVDSYGSLFPGDEGTEYIGEQLTPGLMNQLSRAGVRIFIYHPIESTDKFAWSNILSWDNYSRRNHNKNFLFHLKSESKAGIVVGDSQWANEHFSEKFRGNNVYIEDHKIYSECFRYHQKLIASKSLCPYVRIDLPTRKETFWEKKFEEVAALFQYRKYWKEMTIQFEPEQMNFYYSDIEFADPKSRYTIQNLEIDLLDKAKREIWYATPYFSPDSEMQEAFIRAEKRSDLALRILIAKFRSHPYMPYGTEKAAKNLMKEGCKIYEYAGNGNIHYKDLIVDDFSFIKTANGEGRSRFYNLETGVIIKSAEYAEYNRNHMKLDIQNSKKLHKKVKFSHEKYWIKRFGKTLLCPLYYHHL